ncbi:hypothetical protein [Herbiconiux sp.]|uniref:hypothetical protein n=1 Tax=Herbiconiux sp. TaxID=1871186 RepID=UPI0025BD3BE7|nr:hypothetical protein [Herbiconiux sp.]
MSENFKSYRVRFVTHEKVEAESAARHREMMANPATRAIVEAPMKTFEVRAVSREDLDRLLGR